MRFASIYSESFMAVMEMPVRDQGKNAAAAPNSAPGLPVAPFQAAIGIAIMLGLVCLVCAAATGVFFSQNSARNWQQVQDWRIEWLLGSVAFFLLGLCLQGWRNQA